MRYQQHITLASLGRWLGPLAFVALVATGCGGGSNTGDEAVTTPPPTAGTGDVSTPTTPTPPPTPPVAGISLLAGSIGGPGMADGVGAAARFDEPNGVAVDAAGNVYVADTQNHTIRKITPQGVVTTLAGRAGVPGWDDGSGAAARFYYPDRLAADATGNVYVTTHNAVRKITPTGTVTTLAGTVDVSGSVDGVGAAARFDGAIGVAADGAGNVYVADSGNHTIRKISPSGVVTTLAGTAGSEGSADGTGPAARFRFPHSLAVDASGNVYVIDGNGSGRRITPEGVVTTTTVRAAEVAVDGLGNVYATDGAYTISKITPTGSPTTLAGTDGVKGSTDGVGAQASFNDLRGIAADSAGNVYVADTGNHTIRKIAPSGVVTTFAGNAMILGLTDGTGAQASLNRPSGIAVDSTGSVYVADSGNAAIRKITPTGAVSTLARVPGAPFGLYLDFQQRFGGVAVDEAGNVYVADISNHAILKVTPTGIVTTLEGQAWSVWGTFGSREAAWVSGTFGSDDTAGFYTPRSVAAAGIGSVYVTNLAGHYVSFPGGCNLMGLCARYFSANTILKVSSRGEPPNQNCCSITTLAGAVGVSGSGDGVGTAASFNEPRGIAVDAAGNVYVSDTGNYTIRKITVAGVVTTLAGTAGVLGSSDGVGPAASFESPGSIAVDGAGNVYVSETNLERDGRYSGVIRKITSAGVVTTVAGARGSTDVKLGSLPGSLPEIKGIAVDAKGVLYVATDAAVLKIQLPQ